MRIYWEALHRILKGPLAPIYGIIGQIELLQQDVIADLRDHAKAQGYGDPLKIFIDQSFCRQTLEQLLFGQDLFTPKQWIELWVLSRTPSKTFTDLIQHYVDHLPANKSIAIQMRQPPSSWLKQSWVKKIEEKGMLIPLYPLQAHQVRTWLMKTAQRLGVNLPASAMALILEATQGDLLSMHQLLQLLLSKGDTASLTAKEVQALLDLSQQESSVQDLMAYIWAGEVIPALQQCQRLRKQSTPLPWLLWHLVSECHKLIRLSEIKPPISAAAFQSLQIWPKQQALYVQALKKHSPSAWPLYLKEAAYIDQCIKGVKMGQPWDAIEQLISKLAGQPHRLSPE